MTLIDQTTDQTEAITPADHEAVPSRRAFLSSPWKAVVAAAAGTALVAACDMVKSPFDRANHVLRRATYGATPAARAQFDALGEAAWLAEQLAPAGLDTTALDAKLALLPALAHEHPWDLAAAYPDPQSAAAARAQLQLATVIRAVESPAQLFERMVEFWSDHFNVSAEDSNLGLAKIWDDQAVIRPNALGRFKDLLVGTAKSPAMLGYLDNWKSSVGAINENYARELLELHTVGVDGGYDQADVVDTARILTGWTMFPAQGAYYFNTTAHDTGSVDILGWTRPAGSDYEDHGVQFLHWLAMRPETAAFVCTKIARRFVADFPTPGIVDAMASAWLANDSQIVPVLEAMFSHADFDASAGDKFNRPLDFFYALLRRLEAEITATTDTNQLTQLGSALAALGQLPFFWPAPNGYPDVEGAWMNTGGLLNRWNLTGDVLSNQSPVISFSPAAFVAGLQGLTAAEIYEAAAQRLLLESMTPQGADLLKGQTGWAPGERPNAASISSELPLIAFALLASADALYR